MKAGPMRAVFLDRDGVLNVPIFRDGRSYAPRSMDEYCLYEDAPSSLARLKSRGFFLVVVTNQPDVGNGISPQSLVDAFHQRLMRDLPLDTIKMCCHAQKDGCGCRKPRPGMLLEAAREFDICLADSFMVGDRGSDVEAGRLCGARTIFIDRGYTEPKPRHACAIVRSLSDATEMILSIKN